MKHDKEFLDFLTSQENVPVELKSVVFKDVTLNFRGRSILAKFLFFQVLGALFSMSLCPQFGLGFVEGHAFTHVFRMIGDWACGAFCGSLFLSSGVLLAFICMKGEELWWVWRHYTFSLVLLPAVFWGLLMLTNVSLKLDGESFSYHFIWMVAAILTQVMWMRLRAKWYAAILVGIP